MSATARPTADVVHLPSLKEKLDAQPWVGVITPDQALRLWPQIAGFLAPVLAIEGNYKPIDILSHQIRGEMAIWVAWDMESPEIDAVMVTQVLRMPEGLVYSIPYISGRNMNRWAKRFQESSEESARAAGCNSLMAAHDEWAKGAGYHVVAVVLRKEL